MSCADAPNGSAKINISTATRRAPAFLVTIISTLCLLTARPCRFDGDLHMSVRPAALETAPAITGCVIGDHAQHVLARLAESGGRRRFAAEGHRRRYSARGLFHCQPVFGESHHARATKLAPANSHGNIPDALSR